MKFKARDRVRVVGCPYVGVVYVDDQDGHVWVSTRYWRETMFQRWPSWLLEKL